ncbi:succinate-semialdehyde dehydrogenase (NADP+) [Klebsormidium nitens]|uniref:Succinate-semialdehyde dehydrogenase n=1 Tax=Klebsormidium nitens TaxID=105231 RepID=A0A1Y1ILN7_KLENI|nr:succinate-semialdehyde dehydrogenase (NADP+) [Klebsormidium nitens]|eukprot:GAQ91062.1 succinate-semialdehyde dehydrogenase (NADP+) [Klebsormidium nitens]
MNVKQARIILGFRQLFCHRSAGATSIASQTSGARYRSSCVVPSNIQDVHSTLHSRCGSGGGGAGKRDLIGRFTQRTFHLTPTCQMALDSGSSNSVPKLKDPSLLKDLGLIGGKWVGAHDGKTMPVHNPATGEVVAEVPLMGAQETAEAIAAADEAFQTWSKTTAKHRSQLLKKWYDLMLANKEDLAVLMTVEQGKPLAEARGEIEYGASFVEWFAEEAKRMYGDVIPAARPDNRILVLKQPVGVIAAITPWNFPVAMATRKLAPALAAGCTAVLKPAELTPLSATAVAELALRAGIPAGVINIVMGDAKSIGETLLKSKEVRKLTFTGSTAVGKLLMKGAADTVKKISLELGGNAPFIVFDDADVALAAKGALTTKYRNMGQTCVCANRLLVQEGVYDEFAAAFAAEVAALRVGNGLEAGVTQGPLIDERAVQKIEGHVEEALAKGARLAAGGKRHAAGPLFYEPTILLDATPDMLATREENFGPVAPIMKFKTEEEAIRIANDTEYGLAAYFYTGSLTRGWRVAEALQYGMVGLNESNISTEAAPFGGIKQSGLGREGSKYGIDEYLEMKYVMLGNIRT